MTLRAYQPNLAPGRQTLTKEESHHLAKVMRAAVNDEVALFDGQGNIATARIVTIRRGSVEVEVSETTHVPFEQPVRLTLAVAMPRRQRQPFLFEKCTELGLWAFQPTRYQRSVAKPDASAVDKWTRTVIEAARQSTRTWLPRVHAPVSFDETLQSANQFDMCLLADTAEQNQTLLAICSEPSPHIPNEPRTSVRADAKTPKTICIWIGPEGGLTNEERTSAIQAGANPVTLARHTLRTETAATTATAIVGQLEKGVRPLFAQW